MTTCKNCGHKVDKTKRGMGESATTWYDHITKGGNVQHNCLWCNCDTPEPKEVA